MKYRDLMAGEHLADAGTRLRETIKLRNLTIRGFVRLLQTNAIPRSTYGTVQRYTSGKAQPPVWFLREAAKLLEVSEVWLVLGDTEADLPRLSPPKGVFALSAELHALRTEAAEILEALKKMEGSLSDLIETAR